MDKLQFFFNTLLGEPKALMGSPNNDMVMINCLNELRKPEKVNVSDKKDPKVLSANELKNQICELIESVFQEEYFDNLNDEILKTQVNALELSVRFKNSEKLIKIIDITNVDNIATNLYKKTKLQIISIYLEYTSALRNEFIEILKRIILRRKGFLSGFKVLGILTNKDFLSKLSQNQILSISEFSITQLIKIILDCDETQEFFSMAGLRILTSNDFLSMLNQEQIEYILNFSITQLIKIISNDKQNNHISINALEILTSNDFLSMLSQEQIEYILNFSITQLIKIILDYEPLCSKSIRALKILKNNDFLSMLSQEQIEYISEFYINYQDLVNFLERIKINDFLSLNQKDILDILAHPIKENRELIIKAFDIVNKFSPITLNEKDENRKKEIQEQIKKYQALNHKLLIYYFNEQELKDEFKKYSMKYNIVYYEKSDGWYCFDNYLEQEVKVPTSFNEELQKTPKYNLINEVLDSIPKDKIKIIQSLIAYNTLTKEQIAQSFELELTQVEAIYLSKQGDKYV